MRRTDMRPLEDVQLWGGVIPEGSLEVVTPESWKMGRISKHSVLEKLMRLIFSWTSEH